MTRPFSKDEEIERCKEFIARHGGPGNFAQAFLYHGERDSPSVIIMALDLDDDQQRRAVRSAATKDGAWFVVVAQEVWYVTLEKDADPALVALATEASEAGALDKLPPDIRREKVRLFVEGDMYQTELHEAEITRDASGAPTVGAWEQREVRAPRPTFRRYLPERSLRVGIA